MGRKIFVYGNVLITKADVKFKDAVMFAKEADAKDADEIIQHDLTIDGSFQVMPDDVIYTTGSITQL